jgi:urease accessory protein
MPGPPRTITDTAMSIPMDEDTLYWLMTWLSPAYPVGAFCHSSGLEWAVEAGWVSDRASTEDWLDAWLEHGGGWNDAVLFTHAHRAATVGDGERLTAIASLAAAAHPSAERRKEQLSQGSAFRRAALDSKTIVPLLEGIDGELAYPVAVAAMAAGHGIGLMPSLTAYLHAGTGNLVSAAQRLVPLGQTDAQIVIAALRAAVIAVASKAAALADGDAFDALGGASLLADLASMLHETQYTRLFRT